MKQREAETLRSEAEHLEERAGAVYGGLQAADVRETASAVANQTAVDTTAHGLAQKERAIAKDQATMDALLAQTADAVRGFVRAGGRKVPNDAGLVPPSLVPFAYDFAVFRVLKRFNVAVGEDRRKAYDAAMDVFKKVAAGDMAVEPADDAEGATSATLPSFMPADPERRLG